MQNLDLNVSPQDLLISAHLVFKMAAGFRGHVIGGLGRKECRDVTRKWSLVSGVGLHSGATLSDKSSDNLQSLQVYITALKGDNSTPIKLYLLVFILDNLKYDCDFFFFCSFLFSFFFLALFIILLYDITIIIWHIYS